MARIRSIKPEFWTSEQVSECSLSARLLFIGLWNFADDLGRMPMSAKSIKAKVFPSDEMPLDTIQGMIQELSANGLILPYNVAGKEYLQITGWQHQRIDKPQPGKYPAPVVGYSTNDLGTLATDTIGKESKEGKGKEREDARAQNLPSALPEAFQLSEADIEASHSAGMTDAVIDAELKIFIARKLSDGKKSANWSAEWLIWCTRWKAMKPTQPDARPVNSQDLDWDKQIERFLRGLPWTSKIWGPEPGQGGCRAPPELLAKHGFTPTQH